MGARAPLGSAAVGFVMAVASCGGEFSQAGTGGGGASSESSIVAAGGGVSTTTSGPGATGPGPTASAGGTTGTGGTGGAGGIGGGGAATGGDGPCTSDCGPLFISDVTSIDVAGLPGFDVGFRCKALSVCGTAQSCVYFDEHLGTRQSSERSYYDGVTLEAAAAVKVVLRQGAASQCGNPPVTIGAGENVLVTFDGGQKRHVYFPSFNDTELTLYVRDDGSSYYDPELSDLAQQAP